MFNSFSRLPQGLVLRTVSLPLLLSVCLAGCADPPKITGTNPGSAGSGPGMSGGGGVGGGGERGGNGGTGGPIISIPDASAGGSSGGSGADAAAAPMCGFQDFTLQRVPPEVLLILDRSSSMNRVPTGDMVMAGATLWTDALTALDEVVKSTQTSVHWGLKLFPLPTGCMASPGAEVDVAPTNYDNVMGKARMQGLNTTVPPNSSGTPTDLAMINGAAYLTGRSATTKNPKYIVLATDGAPTCTNGMNRGSPEENQMAAINAVTAAVAAGFKTYVIGIGINAGELRVLNDLAVAGGAPRNDPTNKFYPATNRGELVTALNQITGQISNCVFPLEKSPPSPDDVKVTVDVDRVPQSATDGWSYTSAQNMAIQLNGSYCERVKTKAGKVGIVFGCPNVPIP